MTQAQVTVLVERLTAPVSSTMPSGPPAPQQFRAVPRPQGIASRIRRAEAVDRKEAEPLVAQRKKEYEDRIAALIRPEVEVTDQSDNGEAS